MCSVKLPYNHHTEILQNEILYDPISCYEYYALNINMVENNKESTIMTSLWCVLFKN